MWGRCRRRQFRRVGSEAVALARTAGAMATKPENMLQGILDELEEGGHSLQPLARLCVVGKPMDAHEHVAADAFEKWCLGKIGDTGITGLLLTLPTGWIMLAEGTHAPLTAFTRAVAGQQGRLFEGAKVIHHAEDVPARAFGSWGAKSVSAVRNNYADIEGGLLASMLGDTVIGMLKIGQGDLEKIDSWAEHFPDIPSNERVAQVNHAAPLRACPVPTGPSASPAVYRTRSPPSLHGRCLTWRRCRHSRTF